MGVGEQEDRLAPVRAELPAESILGYFSDVRIGESGGSALLYQTMYAMAPRLVAPDPARHKLELVLGSFHRRPDLEQLKREQGLTLIKDFGAGVRLFRWGEK
jgi:hypothetical protein